MVRHLASVAALSFATLFPQYAPAARDDDQVLEDCGYRLDLPARRPEEKGFAKETRTVVARVFEDKKASRLFYLGEKNTLIVPAPVAKLAGGGAAGKTSKWQRRLLLPIRTFDQNVFGEEPKKIGVEVYRDEKTGHWVYVSHTGSLAILPPGKAPAGKPAQEPTHLYRLQLKVRAASEKDFDTVFKYGLETYWDESAGALIYVGEDGALAVIPLAAKPKTAQTVGTSDWSHALDLKARKPGDNTFDQNTPIIGTEVYRDKNADTWIYATEKLQFAVVPGAKNARVPHAAARPPEWKGVLAPAGAAGKTWSAEIYHNPNADHVLYSNANGFLAAVPAKSAR